MPDILVQLARRNEVMSALAEWEIAVLRELPLGAYTMMIETGGTFIDDLEATVRYTVDPRFIVYLRSRDIPFDEA